MHSLNNSIRGTLGFLPRPVSKFPKVGASVPFSCLWTPSRRIELSRSNASASLHLSKTLRQNALAPLGFWLERPWSLRRNYQRPNKDQLGPSRRAAAGERLLPSRVINPSIPSLFRSSALSPQSSLYVWTLSTSFFLQPLLVPPY